MESNKIAIIGPGVVGSALACLLYQKAYQIIGVAGTTLDKAQRLALKVNSKATTVPEEITSEADIIFITTPDSVITQVSREIGMRGGYKSGQVLVHMSGALPAEVMEEARTWGVYLASVHPLQSFADVEVAMENLPGSFFALEGDKEALILAEKIVLDLAGHCFQLAPGTKGLYHAGASVASNYLVAVCHLAIALWAKAGIDQDGALAGLIPLLKGTLMNIEKLGPTQALTGPIARGDWGTVKRHFDQIAENEQIFTVYKTLGLYTLDIAREKGSIDPLQAGILENLLKGGLDDGKEQSDSFQSKGKEISREQN